MDDGLLPRATSLFRSVLSILETGRRDAYDAVRSILSIGREVEIEIPVKKWTVGSEASARYVDSARSADVSIEVPRMLDKGIWVLEPQFQDR